MFSCKFCEISENTFFTEHLRTTAFGKGVLKNFAKFTGKHLFQASGRLLLEIIPVTALQSRKLCGLIFYQSYSIHLPQVSMATITDWRNKLTMSKHSISLVKTKMGVSIFSSFFFCTHIQLTLRCTFLLDFIFVVVCHCFRVERIVL